MIMYQWIGVRRNCLGVVGNYGENFEVDGVQTDDGAKNKNKTVKVSMFYYISYV